MEEARMRLEKAETELDALEESQIGIWELNMYSNFELCKYLESK